MSPEEFFATAREVYNEGFMEPCGGYLYHGLPGQNLSGCLLGAGMYPHLSKLGITYGEGNPLQGLIFSSYSYGLIYPFLAESISLADFNRLTGDEGYKSFYRYSSVVLRLFDRHPVLEQIDLIEQITQEYFNAKSQRP